MKTRALAGGIDTIAALRAGADISDVVSLAEIPQLAEIEFADDV